MNIIIIIAIIVLVIIALLMVVKHIAFMRDMVWHYQHMNVITYGPKGTGKDLVTDKVIRLRKDFYYANLPYSYPQCEVLNDFTDISLKPNNYEDFVNHKLTKVHHRFKEGKDIYISDGGIYIPSYMDSTLYKKYPSMPVLYALSRQCYGNNIHVNTQNLERVWKALREQADFYVRCVRTYKLPFILITKVITYDNYQSALNKLEPVKTRLLNKYSKAEVDIYNASHGNIRSGHVIQLKKHVKYDTRYFEKLLFDDERLS